VGILRNAILNLLNWLILKIGGTFEFQQASGGESPVMLGRYANSLLKNPAFDTAIKRIEQDVFSAWKTSAPKDKDKRENLFYRIEVLAEIQLKLKGMIENMKYEEKKGRK
jgi:hypothetical protein